MKTYSLTFSTFKLIATILFIILICQFYRNNEYKIKQYISSKVEEIIKNN